MPASQRPLSDMGNEIRKHPDKIPAEFVGQGAYDCITVKLIKFWKVQLPFIFSRPDTILNGAGIDF
jgi:hypothetical protein